MSSPNHSPSMAWLSAHDEIQFLYMPLGTPLWLASIHLSSFSSCHLPSCKLCSSLKSLEYAMLSSCLQAFEHAVLSLDQFSPPSLSYLLLNFQIPDIKRETCLLFDSSLFPYLTSSTFLCINVFLIAINHYRFFLEASEEYIQDCHIMMSGILQQ